MRSIYSKAVLFLSFTLLSGCDLLVTSKSICDGQKRVDLPGASQVNAYTMAFGQDELPRVQTRLIRTGLGHYQIHAGANSDSDTILEVCRIGKSLMGTLLSTDSESKNGPFMVFRIENTQDAIIWHTQIADQKDLDSVGIHYTVADETIQDIPVHSTQVDLNSAAKVSSLLGVLHDDAEGLLLILGKN